MLNYLKPAYIGKESLIFSISCCAVLHFSKPELNRNSKKTKEFHFINSFMSHSEEERFLYLNWTRPTKKPRPRWVASCMAPFWVSRLELGGIRFPMNYAFSFFITVIVIIHLNYSMHLKRLRLLVSENILGKLD